VRRRPSPAAHFPHRLEHSAAAQGEGAARSPPARGADEAAGEEPEFIQTSGRYGDRGVPSAARRTSTGGPRELARLEHVLGLPPADRFNLGLAAPDVGGSDNPVEQMFPPDR
jgi:hypothetical protein